MDGRKSLVDEWAAFLPTYADPFTILGSSINVGSSTSSVSGSNIPQQTTVPHPSSAETNSSPSRQGVDLETEEDHDDEDDGEGLNRNFSLNIHNIKQAVIILF